jgi:hypothetical protein
MTTLETIRFTCKTIIIIGGVGMLVIAIINLIEKFKEL